MTVNEAIEADLKRFQENLGLKPGADIQMILLKGHLLIEELLQQMIEGLVMCPDELEEARLTFHHRLCLARALRDPSIQPVSNWVWDAVRKLNQLRNLMAHSLTPKHFDEKLEDFASVVEKGLNGQFKPGPGKENQMAKLGMALSLLGAVLSQLVRLNMHRTVS